MRTLSLSSLKLLAVLSLAPAMVVVNTGCSGGEDKPGDDDDDSPTDTNGNGDDDDDDDDDDTESTDTGTYAQDTGVLWGAFNGEGTVDLKAGTYTGTYGVYYAIPLTAEFCDLVYTAEDLPSSTVVPQTEASGIDMATCALGSVPCDFAFDMAVHSGTTSAGCSAFGITDKDLAGNAFAYPLGFVDEYNLAGTTTSGKTFDYDLDLLMYYVDYQQYVGWYTSYFGLVGPYYYGGQPTSFDPATGNVTFTDYAYYSIIYI